MKDCTNCKFYMPEADAFAGTLPMCTKFGTPLGKSAADTEGVRGELARSHAAKCSSHTPLDSEVVVDFPVNPPHRIGVSLNQEAVANRVLDPDREQPSGCSKCEWYIPPTVARKELGFDLGVCGAFAQLLGPKELTQRAKLCDVGVRGANRQDSDGIILDPKFEVSAGAMGSDRGRGTSDKYDPYRHASIDPREYPTDRPVSEEDLANCIKAWRKVNHPKGTMPPQWMPIFDWAAAGVERDPRLSYGAHQPDLYVDHAGLLYMFAFLYMGGLNPEHAWTEYLMLIGEAGTGKTDFFVYAAYLMDLPVVRISLTPNTQPEDFFGTGTLEIDPETGQQVTGFKRGRFALAYEQSCVMILDEANTASDAIWLLLRPALDSASQVVIEQERVVLEKDPYNFIGLTGNPNTPQYRGVRPLSGADFNRVCKFRLDLPDLDTEREIVRRHCAKGGYAVPDNVLALLMNVTVRLRQLHDDHILTVPWSIRSNVRVAKLTRGLDIEDAFKVAETDGLPEEQAELILTTVRSYL
jgi:hypothetical protein